MPHRPFTMLSTDPPSSPTPPAAALARWRRAAECARDGLFEVVPGTGETWFSDRFGAVLGFEPGALPATLPAFTTRIHPDDLPLWRHAWQAAVDRAAPILLQLRLLHQDGAWRWYGIQARCWPADGGHEDIVAGALIDIHDHRASQQALERQVAERTASLARAVEDAERRRTDAQHARQAQARFLAHMSHELRTPLAGLLGLLDLAGRVATDAPQRRYLEVAMQSGRALQRTIAQLLELTLVRDGHLPLASEPFDVAESLSEVLRGTMPLVRSKGLSVRYDWLGEPTWVASDEPRVRQIVGNLVGNAAKFTERGHIALVAHLTPHPDREGWRWLSLDVEDTGPGLAPERAARIFDDFVQADASLSRAHGGTGLGLSIARDLARRMGGDITLRSRPGEGSVFTLTLPLRAAADPDPLPDPEPGEAWLLYRQPVIAEWLERRLVRLGWRSRILADGAAAIARAAAMPASGHPQLVVVAEHVMASDTDLAALRQALPQAVITLLIRPDWHLPELEQQALAHDMSFSIMPLSPRDLRLLTVRQPAAPPAPAARPAPASATDHVLVVEDNAVNRMIAEEFLRTLGIPARTAEDGAKALESCAAAPPRLVLMDLQMPVMDGLAATRTLRERQQRGELPVFPIVALTAHAMSTDAEACREAGMVGYLTKPLLLDALRDEVARWWPSPA
jgi:signal transduction histidine kinase/CheY-like chemotaxis protein